MSAGFKDIKILNAPLEFRRQINDIGGVLLALDGIPTSALPGTLELALEDLDGRTYTCSVPVGAAGSVTACSGGTGGSFSSGLGSATTTTAPITTTTTTPVTTAADTSATTTTPVDTTSQQPVTATSTTSATPADCEALRPVSPVVQEGVAKDYAAYKRCAKTKQSDWPPKPVEGFVAEYGQCGIGGSMPLPGVVCETGTVCCQTSSEHAQCADPTDTSLTCIAQLVTG